MQCIAKPNQSDIVLRPKYYGSIVLLPLWGFPPQLASRGLINNCDKTAAGLAERRMCFFISFLANQMIASFF